MKFPNLPNHPMSGLQLLNLRLQSLNLRLQSLSLRMPFLSLRLPFRNLLSLRLLNLHHRFLNPPSP